MNSAARRAFDPVRRTPVSASILVAIAVLASGCARAARPGAPTPPGIPPITAHPAAALVPQPLSVQLTLSDSFTVAAGAEILVGAGQAEAARIGRYLAQLIGTTKESTPAVVMGSDSVPRGSIELALDAAIDSLGEEGYTLSIDTAQVRIAAATPAGLFYGVQTLRQLMPPWIEYTAIPPRPIKVPAARIVDRPRFAWRGAMLDVARHFTGVAGVERLLDLMALYKLNRLHLHLADDQGWRIAIPSWPNLAPWGGLTEVGGGDGGFYTREDWAELVRYAGDRYITIVPEIDMPGHINAALSSYPELNCDQVAPAPYTGTDVGFSILCLDKDVTYRFIDDVVRDIAEITPGPYFHIGADEVKKLTPEQYRGFVERVQGIVASHGKRMIGWSEVAEANLPPSAIVQSWIPDSSRVAVARGSKVILSPSSRAYFDMKYDSTTALGLDWAGRVDLHQAYAWDPASQIEGVPEPAILGVEAPLWAETIGTVSDIEYLLFPRLPALAEMGWTAQSRRDWEDFRARLFGHLPRWKALGVNYYDSPYLR